ncbi:MAG TPA: SgcJ/EcaC family oxidoreductase, partial [Pirellulales bacterium]|nr:SgcJ/EcaC family oxidoreductase [Pirellulales bacterium]
MRSIILFVVVALLCAAGLLLAEPRQGAKPAAPAGSTAAAPARPAAGQPAKGSATSGSSAGQTTKREDDEKAIRDVVARLVKAYNGGDADAIASLFTIDGEMIDDEGARVQGRQAIAQDFAAIFQEHPKAKIEIAIDTIRFLGPTLAIEEGTSTVTYDPDAAAESGRYQVTYAKQDGKWLTGIARELPEEMTGDKALEQLAWLVGNWIDESPQAWVKTSYQWSDDHHFLVGSFSVRIAGRPAIEGVHRIGWDPLAKTVRSWMFDSEGGFGESLWTAGEDDPATGVPRQWIVKM